MIKVDEKVKDYKYLRDGRSSLQFWWFLAAAGFSQGLLPHLQCRRWLRPPILSVASRTSTGFTTRPLRPPAQSAAAAPTFSLKWAGPRRETDWAIDVRVVHYCLSTTRRAELSVDTGLGVAGASNACIDEGQPAHKVATSGGLTLVDTAQVYGPSFAKESASW
jgi:hypothetical protein